MLFRKLILLTTIFISVSSSAVAQTQPKPTPQPIDPAAEEEKAKKKKEMDERVVQMLDQSVADANGLRLAQNRAVVYGMVADLYWKYDDKRSRELFRNAASEIITYNAEAEKERSDSTEPNFDFGDQGDPRNDVLNLVAKHDADLALELLLQTRSPRLADAVAKAAVADVKTDGVATIFDQDRARATQEIALEQRFSQLAAAGDPDKMIKLIKDSMAKSVTPGLISLLQQLNQKDPKTATDLGASVITKLSDADLARNQDDLRNALSFLQYGSRPAQPPSPDSKVKPFAFADASLKDLANKMLNALLVPSKSMASTMMVTQSIPVLEKYVPERIALLKQRDAEDKKSTPTEMRGAMNMQRAWSPSSTPEDLLTQLSKVTNDNEKRQIYPILTSKIGQIADEARAKKLIDQIPDDKTRATAQEQFDAAKIMRAAAAGKIDEARRLIGTLTNRRMQIQRLVALAVQVRAKGADKDIESAKLFMTDAKALTKDYPDDEDDLADIMEVVRGYSAVDPEIAFRMFEPVINEFNDMVQASATLSKYNKRDRTFKKGELVMRANGNFGGGLLMFRYVQQIQLLGKADLDRMSLLADRFGRGDTRTLVKLWAIQGFLAPPPRAPVPGSIGVANTVVLANF